MKKVAILGAGGKMGYRVTANLRAPHFDMRHLVRRALQVGRDPITHFSASAKNRYLFHCHSSFSIKNWTAMSAAAGGNAATPHRRRART